MTALTTAEIIERVLADKFENRLVIAPMLDEEEQSKPGQAAIDVRLGFDFCLVTASSFGFISEFSNGNQQSRSFRNLYRREYVPFGASIVIHPHQFMLAQTLEYVKLPSDLMAYVVGRSTWGRLGLIVATAIGIHPSFAGSLTLELRNLGETPLELHPGQTIAQLFFHKTKKINEAAGTASLSNAQYAGAVDMIPQRISSNSTHETLLKLIERFRSASEL